MKGILSCACGEKWQDLAPFVLRVVVGISFFAHGWSKLTVMGVDNVGGFFAQIGIPAPIFFATLVTWVEILGGAALILGIMTHWASKLLGIIMIVAIFTAHISNGFFVDNGGYEMALVFLGSLISIMITGPGRWALGGKK